MLDKRLDAGLISQEEYDKAVAKADEELERKKIQIERDQAIREKALGIMNATISTAEAIIKAMANPGGLAGVALSVMAGITGAAQIAAIAAQPLPQFANGGIVGGTSYTGDHVPVMANSGEMYINRESQQRLLDALQGNGDGTLGMNYELMAEAMAAAPAPVLVLEELRREQEKVSTIKEIASL